MLTVLHPISVLSACVSMFRMSVRQFNASTWLPTLSVSPLCGFPVLAGEFRVCGSFECVLMFSASYTGVIACVHMFGVPSWFLDSSDSFAQPFVSIVSGFGSFDSIGCMLMVSTSSSAISMSHPMLGVSIHMLDLFARFPQPFGSSERCLALRLGESGGLPLFRGVLTLFGAFAGLYASVVARDVRVPIQHVCVAPQAVRVSCLQLPGACSSCLHDLKWPFQHGSTCVGWPSIRSTCSCGSQWHPSPWRRVLRLQRPVMCLHRHYDLTWPFQLHSNDLMHLEHPSSLSICPPGHATHPSGFQDHSGHQVSRLSTWNTDLCSQSCSLCFRSAHQECYKGSNQAESVWDWQFRQLRWFRCLELELELIWLLCLFVSVVSGHQENEEKIIHYNHSMQLIMLDDQIWPGDWLASYKKNYCQWL